MKGSWQVQLKKLKLFLKTRLLHWVLFPHEVCESFCVCVGGIDSLSEEMLEIHQDFKERFKAEVSQPGPAHKFLLVLVPFC